MTSSADERTPLLVSSRPSICLQRLVSAENRVLFAGFIITLAFSYTQVPLFYVFHLMECDAFYDSHPPHQGHGDRCSRNEIAAGTASQISILAVSTTLCGTLNLFVTGWLSKKSGPRLALVVQTLVPAIRVATQILGLIAGKRSGMMIIQATQLITILGGPSGYILLVNIMAGEVVEPARRTAVFGMLQGAIMFGQGIGYLVGGIVGDTINARAPFDMAFVSFIVCSVYVYTCLPHVAPPSGTKPGQEHAGLLAPLRILVPQRLRLAHGLIVNHYGVVFLCAGIFLGVLATGFAPILLQMYATAEFEFTQADNGWLMAQFAFIRSIFLLFMFPRLISLGRTWMTTSGDSAVSEVHRIREPFRFDLVFLRWSLIVDGALTTVAAFATERWHIYLAAFLLPFGSGSAPAAKGVITEMCTDSQRADALNAVTLVENVARLATQGLFGFVFAAFAERGLAHLTFLCNAAIAVLGTAVLLLSHFPPTESRLVEADDLAESLCED